MKIITCKSIYIFPSFAYKHRLPVAVPDKIFGLALILDFIDRGHSLGLLHLPPAVLLSLHQGLRFNPTTKSAPPYEERICYSGEIFFS